VLAVPGRYSVSYLLLGPNAVVVVDVGSHADHAGILGGLDSLGRSAGSVRLVVPSHLHFDHAMGIDALARKLGAAVGLGEVAHRHATAGRPLRFPRGLSYYHALGGWPMQGLPALALADVRHGLDFGFPWARHRFRARVSPPLAHGAPLPGVPGWTVLSLPGHSDDSIGLHHAEAGFLVAGDTVRNFLGGEWNPIVLDDAGLRATRALIASLPISTIFPAHGPILEGPRVVDRLRTLPAYLP
jgi:glyoxylase-like metal-dependent hydrolase (beta-lactamase superfamily II)